MKKKCTKCDKRGMVKDGPYSAHSCDCGKYQKLMNKQFKNIKIENLLAYGMMRIEEKRKQNNFGK